MFKSIKGREKLIPEALNKKRKKRNSIGREEQTGWPEEPN